MATFNCDVRQPAQPLEHFWEHTIGSGHAPLALRADWQRQLTRCHRELGVRRVRFHGLLSAPMDTLLIVKDKPLYSFFNADQIFDFLHEIGMHPYVEISFIPEALSSGKQTVFHYGANVTPPKDLQEWSRLMTKMARHWVSRYGIDEVSQWCFEVWNEPNMPSFWTGSQREYFELYRRTALALKNVDPRLKVGGPATAKNEWISEFLEFCGQNDVPLDFVSTHQYPTDAFGSPDDDTETQLSKSHRGALREEVQTVRGQMAKHSCEVPLFYTEWSSSSNPRDPLHDQPYAAAFDAKTVLDMQGLVQNYAVWTFSDIFQENYMPSEPFQGGFGLLTINGIPKPAYRAFQMLHRLGDEWLEVKGDHPTVDVRVSRHGDTFTALLTNTALPRHPVEPVRVSIRFTGARRPKAAWLERVDEDHANPRRFWKALGSPVYLNSRQHDLLEAASCVVPEPLMVIEAEDGIELSCTLQPHSVALITLDGTESELNSE